MLLTRKAKLVFMLSNVLEEGRTKCDCYWPKDQESPLVFAKFKVHFESEDYILDNAVIQRNFIIFDEGNNTKANITQLHVVCWPDHSAPTEELGFKMIELLLSYVDDYRASYVDSPIVVHCR
jgi:protein tyrosine phosphatase